MNFAAEKPIYLQIVDVIADRILTADGVIYNRRGIGYFVADDARETVLSAQRKEFMEKELPAIRERMRLLGIDFSTLNETDHA